MAITLPQLKSKSTIHGLLILVWITIGIVLRFTLLDSKTPWTDEWSTIVFSLGHSFRSVPLDGAIGIDTLLQPLQLDQGTNPGNVVTNLMTESTHPPLYFLLTHWWLKLFSGEGQLVSIWLVRSLSALFGAASVGAIFGLAVLLFRSLLVGHLAAALMAVSPYGVYLAQEARHYTLAILGVIVSFACLVVAVNQVKKRAVLPLWLVLLWVIVNSLGIAIHYFFALALAGQGLVLLRYWLQDCQTKGSVFSSAWLRIYGAGIGTLIGASVWLSAWRSIPDQEVTQWIHHGNPLGAEFLEPIGRLLAWIVTMLFLLPVERVPLLLIVASSLILLLLLLWLTPIVFHSLRSQLQQSSTRLPIEILIVYILGEIALILLITYTFGTDLTLAARYHFVYFPALIILMAAALAYNWQHPTKIRAGKAIAIVTLLFSLIGGLVVVSDLGYQKADRADLVAVDIIEASRLLPQTPILIATVHKTHEQTGEMMGLAWELRQQESASQFQFLLAHKDNRGEEAAEALYQTIAQFPRPFGLWLVNFSASIDLKARNCKRDKDFRGKAPGYRYRFYACSR